VTVAAAAAKSAPNITLAAAGSLAGVVTTQGSGARVPFAVIAADIGSQLVETTQANSDGSFNLPNLPPGTYTLTASISGFFDGSATAIVVAGQATSVPSFTVAPAGSVAGRVTRQSTGAALPGVWLTIFSGGKAVDYAVTDANGGYEIDNLADGTYDVTVGAVGSEGAASSSVTLSAASPSATANFVLAVIGSISGTTLASDGSTPASDVPVTLYSGAIPLLQENSDDNGNFQFLLFAPGSYHLLAADETAVYGNQAALAITVGTDLTSVQLVARTSMVTGTFKDAATGDPLPGAVLHISGAGIDGFIDTLTDQSGNYQFAGPAGDQLTISSDATGYAYQTQQVTLPASGSTTLNFSLTAGITFSGTIAVGGTEAPLANATVAVRNENGPLDWYTAVSDAQGNFLVDTLPAGTYDVVVAATGYQSLVVRGMAISGTAVARTFSLDPASISVSGVVSDSSGRGLSGAYVLATDAAGNIIAETATGALGDYTLTALPAGTFTLTATLDGAAPVSLSPLTVAAGAAQAGVDFTLRVVTIDPGGPGGVVTPNSIVSGALSLLQYQSPPRRLASEVQLPTLPAMTCQSVINDYIMIQNYVRLANKYFAVWQENYTSGQNVQYYNVGTVALQGVKLSGDAASVVLDIALIAKAFPKALSSIANGIAEESGSTAKAVLDAVKSAFDRFDKFVNSVRTQVNDNNAAIAEGKSPSTLDNFNTLLGFLKQGIDEFVALFGEVESKVAKLWGKASPIAGLINDLLSAYSDYNTLQSDYSTAVTNINGVGMRDQNAASLYVLLEGYAKSALNDYNTDLALCRDSDPKVSPVLPPPGGPGGPTTTVGVGGASDPNNLTGPAGFGGQGFIQPEAMPFEVDFENDPAKATAAAQVVTATMTLDPNVDPSTFQFTGFGFGAYNFTVPEGLSNYSTTIDLRPDGIDLLVPVTLNLNQATGVVTVTFRSLDPATMQAPDGINDGFLPVDDANHDGEGFFTYTMHPKAGLPTGTKISAQASIVFDTNAAISTPTSLNTLDVVGPTSTVATLPSTVKTPTFTVAWSGSDDTGGSNIAFYDVFVSDNGGPFVLFLAGTTATSASFQGIAGHTYAFYSVASDNVGNRQPTPTSAQATTFVDAPPTSTVNSLPSTTTATSFTVSWSGSPGAGATSITSYEIFVSEDGGSFTPFLSNTTQTPATFAGKTGHSYGFFSVATNNLGLVQPTPGTAQATTTVANPPPAPPTIIGEKAIFQRKTNKKGKPVGKAVLTGFSLTFSEPLNAATAKNRGDYQLATVTTKKVKKKLTTILHPISKFTVSYNLANDSVNLTLIGTQAFPTGGKLTVVGTPPYGVSGASGAPLSGTTVFAISKKGSTITPSR
jgi:Carboxypeptidase regulatory-like domain